ncbi:alpha/beta fold hydrolase [Nocardia sp. BMG111209]|uniref:alpha/beta fold hydrolase n=1 Tax=Nocardia sp. BMG111209 TaxID=1160137 RepID=UPI0018CB8CA9|nr:alpha/beta hydrolase [Nocardia sp. BMG111209]
MFGRHGEESRADRPRMVSRRRALSAGGILLGAGVLSARAAGRAPASPPAGDIVPKGIAVDAPWHAKVREAGYVAKTAEIDGVRFGYREGPASGPALVLLHAQQMDWFSYSRVLPALAADYHVFDIDYQGHGGTRTPAGYPMAANRIGADLAALLDSVVGRPAYVTGNSSGGLLAAWLAAERPDLVTAVLLEDPPLFASEYPRIEQTIAYRDFASSHKAIGQHVDDFLLFWIDDSREFFDNNVFPGSNVVLADAVRAQRLLRPGVPVELDIVGNDMIRLFLRGMDHQYDPAFGDAFYRGTWNEGFDHAAALARITAPTMLLHANYSWVDGDILYGAMDQQDADRAMSLLPNGFYQRIDAEHVTHLDAPAQFTAIARSFFPAHP